MTKLTVTVITYNEGPHIVEALAVGRRGPTRSSSSIRTAPTTPSRTRAPHASRVEVRDWTGYGTQKNYAAALASQRLDSVGRRRRAGDAGAGRGNPGAAPRRPGATGLPDSAGHVAISGRWIRSTDWYPDYHVRLYDRRAARWSEHTVHESIDCPGRVETAARRAAALPVSRHLGSPREDRSLHDAGRRAVVRRRAATVRPAQAVVYPRLAFLRNYVLRRGFRDGQTGLHRLAAELLLRVPEVREAVRAAARRPDGADSTNGEPQARGRSLDPMFSLHIDTARTWRGGQNQVLVTVMGLRALGHRDRAGGASRRRAAPPRGRKGSSSFRWRRATEMDLAAAWRLSRVIKQLRPDIVHAHDPHGVAMAALGAVDEHAAGPSRALVASRRVDFHLRAIALSRWKYRQVDCFICASEAIRQMLVARRHPADADGHGPRRHRPRRGWRRRRRRRCTRSCGCRTTRRSSATSRRSSRTRGSGISSRRRPGRAASMPDARFVIAGEGELRDSLERQIRAASSREARHAGRLPHRRPLAAQGLRRVRDELGDRRARHLAARRDGLRQAGRRDHGGRHSRSRRRRRDRPARAAARSAAMAAAIVRLLADPGLRQQMGEAGLARVRTHFSAETMVQNTLRVYQQVVR